jgi:xylulokinase
MTAFGLDIGTSGAKGIALSPDGEVLARAGVRYELLTPKPDWSEQDPEEWWRACRQVLDQLRAAAGTPAGIGLSGQMHGLVALDREDRPVRNAILWNDQRTAQEVTEIESLLGLEEVLRLTGNRPLTGFTAPKLLWLRRREPESYARIATVMLPKDYVRLRLCGERVSDVSDASGTLLFDVGGRRWSPEMCHVLEVPERWLVPALESPEVSGTTSDGVPVAAGAGDQAAGALGVGVDRPGPASVVLGTSGVVFAALERFEPDPEGRTHTFCHAVPGHWHAMGVMLSAAGSLQWLHDTLAPQASYDELFAEAEASPPGADGLVFLPYLAGERTPHADPHARGAFVGLTLRHRRGAIVRAVLEGVAFGLRDCLDVVRDVAGGVSSGVASGGGARSDLWLRIVATALGIPVSRTLVDEGAAFGAALLGGVAAGVWRNVGEAAAATVQVVSAVDPQPEWSDAYAETLERFRALYPAIRAASAPSPNPIPEESIR